MLQPLLAHNLPQVREILRTHRVQEAYAFGSVCTDRFNDDSDVDFMLRFSEIPFGQYAENYWSLEESLQRLLGREIDIVLEKNVKNPYFLKVLAQTKTRIL